VNYEKNKRGLIYETSVYKFAAIGCPDVEAPVGGWIQRTEQTVLMGCSHSSDTWQLYCQDFVWIGQMRNCSAPAGLSMDYYII